MKAKPESYEITVNYICDHCNNGFSLYNRDIPTIKTEKVRCPDCGEMVYIEPLDIFIEPKAPVKSCKKRFLKTLRNYGYSSEEIKSMLVKAKINDFPEEKLSVLLKLALAQAGDSNE